MDGNRFDDLTRVVSRHAPTSRRDTLRLLAGSALAAALGRFAPAAAQDVAAGRCRGLRKECRGDNQCCSGRCRKKRCRRAQPTVPLAGTCQAEQNVCRVFIGADCNGGPGNGCSCFVTVGGARLCSPGLVCQHPCTSDQQCQVLTGPGSGCVPLEAPFCDICSGVGAVCASACPNPV